MRKKTAAIGAILIILAAYLYVSPSITSPISASLGQVSTDTVFQHNSVIPIAPQNYSYYEANLTQGDSLVVTLTTNPSNVDVLIMNQGNFSLWASGKAVAYSTYPESVLHVSNYSFTFTNSEKSQNFYVVLVSHSASEPTEVLLQATGTRPSQFAILLFPVLVGFVGLIVLYVGLRGGGPKDAKQDRKGKAKPTSTAASVQARPLAATCVHCGAELKPGSQFCPVCNKSQL